MESYPDPEEHYQRFVEKKAKRYVQGLGFAGLRPSEKLTRRVAERMHEEAVADYEHQAQKVHEGNIAHIIGSYKREMRKLDQEGAKLSVWMCPPMVAFLVGLACWMFQQNVAVAMVYGVAALVFLVFLVRGVLILVRK